MRWLWFPVLGAMLVVGSLTVTSVTTVISDRRIPDWQGPERTWLDFLPAVSGLLVGGIAVVSLGLVLLRTRTPDWVFPVGSIVASGVVCLTSLALWTVPRGLFGHPFGTAEMLGLALAIGVAAYRATPVWLIFAVGTTAVALLSDRLRDTNPLAHHRDLVYIVLGLMIMVAPALYLRWRDRQRRDQLAMARQEERLSIARDLHDVVAHQVTGIVVRVQALRHITAAGSSGVGSGEQPAAGAVRDSLPEIEAAASDALRSMRDLVHTLRDPGDPPSGPFDATPHLTALRQERRYDHPEVRVTVDGPLDDLPPDVGQSVIAVARESVTNALRHAVKARRIDVGVWHERGSVHVRVVDDGNGSPSRAPRGGYGLEGMRERAHLLGGTLDAGPPSAGGGWRVHAALPTTRVGVR